MTGFFLEDIKILDDIGVPSANISISPEDDKLVSEHIKKQKQEIAEDEKNILPKKDT